MNGAGSILPEILPFIRELFLGIELPNPEALVRVAFFALLAAALVVVLHAVPPLASRVESALYLRKLPSLDVFKSFEGDEKARLLKLTKECGELGLRIDRHTNRPGNSAAVSRLVYAMLEDEAPLTRLLITLAAMVYDAGFLEFNQAIFYSDIVSQAELRALRAHVMRGIYHFGFIDGQYRDIFLSASVFHHENQDGSGYPEGLSGEQIPCEARVIHAAETFTALTHARNYHRAVSARRALAEMKRNSTRFDGAVLKMLERAVTKSRPPRRRRAKMPRAAAPRHRARR